MKWIYTALLFLFVFAGQALTFNTRIIDGSDITDNAHPGAYNTVALLKSSTNKAFCTGSLIKQDLVVTAKHCLVDKKLKDIKVFLGESDQDLDNGLIIEPEDFQVRYKQDWDMFFPSFDIAWIKLKTPAPFPFKALPFLDDPSRLRTGQDIHLVGFGNSSPTEGKVVAGKKLQGMTKLESYLDNNRYYNILSFKGEPGQGTCHGDSGGPAYAQIDGQWYILGVANGFDPVITTSSMERTTDPEFPYKVKCHKNQSLYSFVGAHQRWIEQTSFETFNYPIKTKQDKTKSDMPRTLIQWCQSSDIGSPSWNLLKHILNIEIDKRPQKQGKAFFLNCDLIVKHLESIKNITIDFETHSNAHYNLEPLSLLPNLKKVYLNKVNLKKIIFGELKNKSFDELIITNSLLDSLEKIPVYNIKELNISNNPIVNLNGIEEFSSLETLKINRTNISDLSQLKSLHNLSSLGLSGIKSETGIRFLDQIVNIRELNIHNTPIDASTSFKNLANLEDLRINGNTLKYVTHLDLSNSSRLKKVAISNAKDITIKWPTGLSDLEDISITNSSLSDISFIKLSNKLKKANFFRNNITDLSVFKNSYPNLSYLSLILNPIANVSNLNDLPALRILLLRGTSLDTNVVIKTPVNCPVSQDQTNLVTIFCKK